MGRNGGEEERKKKKEREKEGGRGRTILGVARSAPVTFFRGTRVGKRGGARGGEVS